MLLKLKRLVDKIPSRLVLGIMLFTAATQTLLMRVNISLNIIAMVEPASSNQTDTVSSQSECVAMNRFNSTDDYNVTLHVPDFGPRFTWNPQIQGYILGAYYWGSIVTSIPAGYLSERFGATKVVGISSITTAVLTILCPIAAKIHFGALLAARFVIGLMGGLLYPSLHVLISKWAPPVEKGKFICALTGSSFGTIIAWPLCSMIISHLGWEWSFYIPGILVLVWSTLWFYFVSDSPEEHPRITCEEKQYISESIGKNVNNDKKVAPYGSIFKSRPFWALAILHFGSMWGLQFLMTSGPKFISEVLGFKLMGSGSLATLPYIARLLFSFIFGSLGDFIVKKKWMSVTMIRKFFCIFSHILPGLLILLMLLVGCDPVFSILVIVASLGFNGSSTLTNLQNPQDLAPNFAGTLYGTINTLGYTTGFITPALVGYMTKERNGLAEWHKIFMIQAAVYIGTAVVFIIFGTGKIRKWNFPKTDEETKENKEKGQDNPSFQNTENKAIDEVTKI